MNTKAFDISCDCGCGKVHFEFWDDDEAPWFFISYYIHAFYGNQRKLRKIFFGRLKAMWAILCGKDYCLYETTVSRENLLCLRNWINEIPDNAFVNEEER